MNPEELCCLASFPQAEHLTAEASAGSLVGEHQLRSPVSRAAWVVNCVCALIHKNAPLRGASRTKPPPALSAHHPVWSHEVPDSVCR